MKQNISFDEFTILEWYDGMVRAVGKNEQGYYLLVLVAWNMLNQDKLYLVLESEPSTIAELENELKKKRSIEENWEGFNHAFAQFIKTYSGNPYLLQGELVKNKTYELRLVDRQLVEKVADYDFDKTTDRENLEYWGLYFQQ